MSFKKGFTLIEILVVLIITAILIAVGLPNYNTMMQNGAAKAAQNNLVTIYNAQKTYYLNNSSYCTTSCTSLANINTALSLNITDSNFAYTCSNTGGFQCTATNNGDANLILTLTNNPIILPGGTGTANPGCATDVAAYCPS